MRILVVEDDLGIGFLLETILATHVTFDDRLVGCVGLSPDGEAIARANAPLPPTFFKPTYRSLYSEANYGAKQ
jgi:hypothetical protein